MTTPPASSPAPVVSGSALEYTACPLCASEEESVHYRFPPYAVVACVACGFTYLRPRLGEGKMRSSYAEESYFEGEGLGYASYLAQEPTLRLTFRRFLGELERRGMTGGRLLEVGCAYGFFLDEARGAFDERVGTDYSAAALSRARPRADRVILGGLEDLPPGEAFDLAASIHVIEHVYDPKEFLDRLLGRLRPGGWVALATPDFGGFWRPLLGRRWPFFKIPEHVTYFDRGSLRRLLESAGCLDIQDLPYHSRFSLALVGEKLGLRVPEPLGSWRIALPATTIAAAGRKP